MSTENTGGDRDLPPSPFPDTVVYAWFSILEAVIVATLVVFALGILEGGAIIPNVLAELSVGLGTFVVVFLVLFSIRLRK